MVGLDFCEFVHRKDITMVKTQLSTTVSEEEEKTVSKNSFILKEVIENSGNLCPGAKRSFICRMKKAAKEHGTMSMGTKTSTTKTKGNVMVDETDPVLSKIHLFRCKNILFLVKARVIYNCTRKRFLRICEAKSFMSPGL